MMEKLLRDQERMTAMSGAAMRLAVPDSAARIAEALRQLNKSR